MRILGHLPRNAHFDGFVDPVAKVYFVAREDGNATGGELELAGSEENPFLRGEGRNALAFRLI